MITQKAEKRIRIPADIKNAFSSMVSDAAHLNGTDESTAIIDMVMEQSLPDGALPRGEMLAVHGGKTLLRSVGDTLRGNVNGATGTVAHCDYRGIVDFGLDLIFEKDASTALLTDSRDMPHLVRCFSSSIDFMEHAPQNPDDPFAEYELRRATKYGRDLIHEISVVPSRGPAYHTAYFAVEYFELIGAQNSTCAYLADLFTALDDSLAALVKADPDYRVPADTPELRRKWAETLESTCKDW